VWELKGRKFKKKDVGSRGVVRAEGREERE
jgi:hypothetical protein